MRLFTLSDLLVTLIVGTLLLFYALPSFKAESRTAREGLFREALEQVRQGLEEFYARFGRYPANDQRFLPSQLESGGSFSYPPLLRGYPLVYISDGESYRIYIPLPDKRALFTDDSSSGIRIVSETDLP